MKKIVVLGGGGFIGGHLAKRLKEEGNHVRICDIKKHEYFFQDEICNEFILGDLTDPKVVDTVIEEGVDEVYQLAADMGGALYIFTGENDANLMHNSATIVRVGGIGGYLQTAPIAIKASGSFGEKIVATLHSTRVGDEGVGFPSSVLTSDGRAAFSGSFLLSGSGIGLVSASVLPSSQNDIRDVFGESNPIEVASRSSEAKPSCQAPKLHTSEVSMNGISQGLRL